MISKKSILYILVIAVAVGFSGCKKKPRRPNPIDTVIGSTDSGRGERFGNVDDTGTFAPGEVALQSGQGRDGSGERGIISAIIYFDFDSSSIKSSERAKLTQVANYLANNPGHRLVLEGHCDWRGTPEYNLGLGDRRCQNVRQYLETLGVSAQKLETLSKGDLNAIENASAAQMAEDRRVEFLVIRR